MKKILLGAVLAACGLYFCGCGNCDMKPQLREIQPEIGSGRSVILAEDGSTGEDRTVAVGGAQREQGIIPPLRYAVSGVEAAVRCEDAFYKLNYAAGGQYVYVCGSRVEPPDGGSLADSTYFVGVAEAPEQAQESLALRELDVDLPEDMRVLRMTVDSAGNCHLLWVSKGIKSVDGQILEAFTYEKIHIMEIAPDGAVRKRIDVSEAMAEEHGLMYCFCVDGAGNYYVECGSEIIRLEPDGNLLPCITCPGRVEGIGCGRSGAVYCACRDENNVERLCRIEGDGVVALAELPPADTWYPCIGAGTDTELIAFHRDGGIYALDAPDGGEGRPADGEGSNPADAGSGPDGMRTELRVREADMPVSGQDIGGAGVLGDGRVCLFSQSEKGNATFYYIPVGR